MGPGAEISYRKIYPKGRISWPRRAPMGFASVRGVKPVSDASDPALPEGRERRAGVRFEGLNKFWGSGRP